MAGTQDTRLVGITGGIGAGKSVVSRILRLKGYQVYDCDSRAKELMSGSEELIAALRERFGESCTRRTEVLTAGLYRQKSFPLKKSAYGSTVLCMPP